MCDLLKLPKQMPRKTSAEGQILFKYVFPICSTMLGISQLCLPMLHLWTVAKTALRQENQMDYKKISGILSNLHPVSKLNQQQTAFQKCLWHLVAEKHKNPNVCTLPSILWSVIHRMTALTFCSWPCGSSPPRETMVVCLRWHKWVMTMWERNEMLETQRVKQIRG